MFTTALPLSYLDLLPSKPIGDLSYRVFRVGVGLEWENWGSVTALGFGVPGGFGGLNRTLLLSTL